jgi:hypothetical protein
MANKQQIRERIDCRKEGCPGEYVFIWTNIFSTLSNGMSCGRVYYKLENAYATCSECGSDWMYSPEKKLGCKFTRE